MRFRHAHIGRQQRRGTGSVAPRALAAVAACAWAIGAASLAAAGVWTSYTQREGLPGTAVDAIAGTPWGTILVVADNVASADSVAEYDGIRFRNLIDRYPAPPDFGDLVVTVAASPNGTVWAGSLGNGVFELNADGWRRHTRDDGLGGRASNLVRSVLVHPDGSLWAAVQNGGLSRWDGVQWTTVGLDQGLPTLELLDVALAADGSLWIAHTAGLSRWDGATLQNVAYAGGFTAVTVSSDGHVWASRPSHGAAEFDAGGNFLVRYFQGSVPPSLPTNDVTTLVEGTHGDLWFGTFSLGLSRRTVSGWEALTTSDGLLGNTVSSLHRDAAGVLWVGTNAGLSRYEGALWMTWNQGAGLTALEVNGLSRGPAEDLQPPPPAGVKGAPVYAALGTLPPGASGGIARLAGLAVEPVLESGAPITGRFRAVSAVGGGAWAVEDGSLVQVQGTTAVARLDPRASPLDHLRSVLAARDGGVWVGSDSALFRWDGSAFARYEFAALGAKPDIRSLAEDAAGRIWIASLRGGAARLDPTSGALTLFGSAQGVPGTQFNAVHVTADDAVWIGGDQGAARLVADQVQFVANSGSGLPSDVVFAFDSHPSDERVWIASQGGVAFYEDGAVAAYGPADGLPSPSARSLAALGPETLVGTLDGGIGLFHPDRTAPRGELQLFPPPVSGARRAQFFFGGGDLESGESFLRYAWALDGMGLTAFTAQRSAIFDDLPDGTHRFALFLRDRALNIGSAEFYDFEIDATPPQPVLAQPAFGAVVRGAAPLVGRIDDPRFALYRVDLRPAGPDDPVLNPWTVLHTSTALPANGDTVFVWDTTPHGDGDYELRVVVRDTLGLVGYAAVGVTVDNLSPGDAVTTPARVSGPDGGRVFTLNSELQVYFPPNALDGDRIVEIDSVALASIRVPAGVDRWLAGWRIAAAGAPIAKPVTLTFALAPLGAGAAAPSVSRLAPDSTLAVLGGTVDRERGTLTTAADELGVFLVGAGTPLGFASGDDAELDVQPRAFSPKGGTFDDRAAVAFTLAQGGDARVRVYDRSGRLVRVVFDGPLAAGRNVVYWDGRDGSGEVLPSGVYVVALEAGGGTETRSVAVVNR